MRNCGAGSRPLRTQAPIPYLLLNTVPEKGKGEKGEKTQNVFSNSTGKVVSCCRKKIIPHPKTPQTSFPAPALPLQKKSPSRLRKRQNPLPPLGITHPMNPNIIPHLDIIHRLGGNQHELPAHTPPRSLDHQGHTGSPIDTIHEDVEFVKTADRRAHSLPDGEEEADGGEGFFAAG